MKNISSDHFCKIYPSNPFVIDVRTPDEFRFKRLPNSINIPLSNLTDKNCLDKIPHNQELYLLCRTGRRSADAVKLLQLAGYKNTINIDGGITGLSPLKSVMISESKTLPVMQQVQIIASFMILTGLILGLKINSLFLILPAFAGFGLALAGFTGFCPMARLLDFMPWNKNKQPGCSL